MENYIKYSILCVIFNFTLLSLLRTSPTMRIDCDFKPCMVAVHHFYDFQLNAIVVAQMVDVYYLNSMAAY